jgi:hypothetical protein
MRRTIAALVCAAGGLAGVGCSSLKYEQKTPDGGVIAFKVKDRDAALNKLKQDYGSVEIEAEYDPKANTPGKPFDPSAPVKPSGRMAAGGSMGSLVAASDDGVMHIKFSKKATTPAGLPPAPADDGLVQAGYARPTAGGAAKAGGSALPPPDMTGMPGH